MGLFELRAEISVAGTRIVVVNDGDSARVVQALSATIAKWEPTNPRGGLHAPLSWPLVVQMAEMVSLYGGKLSPGPKLTEWTRAQIERRTVPAELGCSVTEDAPAPRDYQVSGARMIADMKRALLFDEMGTGKTLTSLLGLTELLYRKQLAGPTLVVCPNSVVDDWVAAAWRWTPFYARAYRGTPSKRRALLRGCGGPYDMIVTGYGVLASDSHYFETTLKPNALVVDELHWCKDPQANRSRAMRTLSEGVDVFVGLSGTPITHRTKGLWPALYAIDPAWSSFDHWTRLFIYSDGDLIEARDKEFRRCIVGQHRRVAKADVLAQLPPKIHTVRHVDLPPAARKVYDGIQHELTAEVEGGTIEPMGVLAMLMRLNQLASATGSVITSDDEETTTVRLKVPSWKIDVLMEILEERGEAQTVVFAPSRQLIELAGHRATKDGYRVGYIIGGQKPDERSTAIRAFQDGELDVILATTGAGGVGVTLTAASAVVFLQRPWSFVEAAQAEDRAHRIGSERHESIDIIDIVATDTVDQYVRDTIRDKADSLAKLLEDPKIVQQCFGGQE